LILQPNRMGIPPEPRKRLFPFGAQSSRSVWERTMRHPFSRVDLKRAVTTARQLNLPIERIEVSRDGAFSIVVGKTDQPAESLNEWDEQQPTK
jgi:hypothetical protein